MMRVVFVPEALADIMAAILLCPVEISGLGRIERQGASDSVSATEFLVKEIVIFEQDCSSASTEFDPAAKGRWENAMVRAGRALEINEHHFWWHSHVCGPAYFSFTDHKNIGGFDIGNWQAFDPKVAPPKWWVSLVGNKFGELAVRADFYDPREIVPQCEIITVPQLGRQKFRELIQDRVPRIQAEIAEKVKMDLRILSREEMRNPRWR